VIEEDNPEEDKPSGFRHVVPCRSCGAGITFKWIWENATYPRFAYWTRCANCVAADLYKRELKEFYNIR